MTRAYFLECEREFAENFPIVLGHYMVQFFWGVRASKKIQKARGSKVRKDRGSKVKKAAKILRHANLDTIWSKSSENIFAALD